MELPPRPWKVRRITRLPYPPNRTNKYDGTGTQIESVVDLHGNPILLQGELLDAIADCVNNAYPTSLYVAPKKDRARDAASVWLLRGRRDEGWIVVEDSSNEIITPSPGWASIWGTEEEAMQRAASLNKYKMVAFELEVVEFREVIREET